MKKVRNGHQGILHCRLKSRRIGVVARSVQLSLTVHQIITSMPKDNSSTERTAHTVNPESPVGESGFRLNRAEQEHIVTGS